MIKITHVKRSKLVSIMMLTLSMTVLEHLSAKFTSTNSRSQPILLANGHIVLTRNDHSSSLVLTGSSGKGKGMGKGKGSGGQVVITGNMGGHGSSNMVLENAASRDGDVVISGKSMIVPGEDGHIVLADGRSQDDGGQSTMHNGQQANLLSLWLPYMYGANRFNSRSSIHRFMPFFGNAEIFR